MVLNVSPSFYIIIYKYFSKPTRQDLHLAFIMKKKRTVVGPIQKNPFCIDDTMI